MQAENFTSVDGPDAADALVDVASWVEPHAASANGQPIVAHTAVRRPEKSTVNYLKPARPE
jgi:hypothetical protein